MLRQNDGAADTKNIYVWLSRDADGAEGIIAWPTANGIMPLMGADEKRARGLANLAQIAARERNAPARLVRFTRTETLLELEG